MTSRLVSLVLASVTAACRNEAAAPRPWTAPMPLADGRPAAPWQAGSITLVPVSAGWPGSSRTVSLILALTDAAARWNGAACATPRLHVAPPEDGVITAARDGLHHVLFREVGGVSEPGGVRLLPEHFATTVGRGASPDDATLVEADVEVNAVSVAWEARTSASEGGTHLVGTLRHRSRGATASLVTILTHELGHVLGLGHAPPGAPRSVMQPAVDEHQAPSEGLPPEDVAALCALYPSRGP